MSIADYIRDEVLRPRLQKAGCLVVYDPERRYRDLCRAMASEGVEVVDASDSSIESREAASAGLLRIGRGEEPNELLIYAPAPPPTTDEDRQGDPFAAFAVCGAMYPNGAADDYRRLAGKAQHAFTKHLETVGWPPDGRMANAAVYDTFVAPALAQHGRRVAYILVDALRYELGVVLKQQLGEDNPTELTPAFAQLPTVTRVGMASLLPGG